LALYLLQVITSQLQRFQFSLQKWPSPLPQPYDLAKRRARTFLLGRHPNDPVSQSRSAGVSFSHRRPWPVRDVSTWPITVRRLSYSFARRRQAAARQQLPIVFPPLLLIVFLDRQTGTKLDLGASRNEHRRRWFPSGLRCFRKGGFGYGASGRLTLTAACSAPLPQHTHTHCEYEYYKTNSSMVESQSVLYC
jgi:hypothetical protein